MIKNNGSYRTYERIEVYNYINDQILTSGPINPFSP